MTRGRRGQKVARAAKGGEADGSVAAGPVPGPPAPSAPLPRTCFWKAPRLFGVRSGGNGLWWLEARRLPPSSARGERRAAPSGSRAPRQARPGRESFPGAPAGPGHPGESPADARGSWVGGRGQGRGRGRVALLSAPAALACVRRALGPAWSAPGGIPVTVIKAAAASQATDAPSPGRDPGPTPPRPPLSPSLGSEARGRGVSEKRRARAPRGPLVTEARAAQAGGRRQGARTWNWPCPTRGAIQPPKDEQTPAGPAQEPGLGPWSEGPLGGAPARSPSRRSRRWRPRASGFSPRPRRGRRAPGVRRGAGPAGPRTPRRWPPAQAPPAPPKTHLRPRWAGPSEGGGGVSGLVPRPGPPSARHGRLCAEQTVIVPLRHAWPGSPGRALSPGHPSQGRPRSRSGRGRRELAGPGGFCPLGGPSSASHSGGKLRFAPAHPASCFLVLCNILQRAWGFSLKTCFPSRSKMEKHNPS